MYLIWNWKILPKDVEEDENSSEKKILRNNLYFFKYYILFPGFFFQETKDEDLEKLVQAHCRLDLTAPMPGCATSHQRNLLFEGDLKLKEGTASKVSNIL